MKSSLSLLMLVVIASSCSLSSPLKEFGAMSPTATEAASKAETEAQTDLQNLDYKIVYNAKMTMAVNNQDTAAKYIQKVIAQNEGRLFKRDGYQFTFKLNPDKLESAMDLISLLGEVKERNVRSNDVTSSYYDTKVRLENAIKVRERYLKLLDRANTIDEILRVERELERINKQIDLLTGQMNLMKSLVAKATLDLELKKDAKLGVISHLGNGVYKGVKWLFVTN